MRRRTVFTGMLFVLPWVVGFVIFTFLPMYDTLMLSFQSVRITGIGMLQTPVGWENYRNIFVYDTQFIAALTDYLTQTLLFIPLILIFSLIIAMLLNIPGRFRGLFRVIFFLPVIISSGPVLGILEWQGALHLPGNTTVIDFLLNTGFIHPDIVERLVFLINSFILILWNSGLQILIFLAALQKQDHNMVEAAQIDGASRWVVFWKLTLVSLNPMIVVNTFFTVVSLSFFANNPILTKITNDMFNPVYGYGYASALAWIFFAISLLVVAVSFVLVYRKPGKTYGLVKGGVR
jgi:ABC-type sugar transport system permease subunit